MRELARQGALVVATDLNEVTAKAFADEVGQGGTFLPHDVSREDRWAEVAAPHR